MVKKARDLERIHRDPYAEKRHDAYRQSGQGEGERERERERMHDEERRARRDQREKERLAQIEAHAAAEAEKEKERKREKEKEKEKAKEKDPDPKRKEHTRPPTVIVDTAKGAQYRRIGFLGEVSSPCRLETGEMMSWEGREGLSWGVCLRRDAHRPASPYISSDKREPAQWLTAGWIRPRIRGRG